ncbi:hypothetical protein LX77_00675 [Gelidibacter algens]|uniref:Uncharacterized protein n=1 Tax=Gelidibacter algens TaxID=49280 RepID=A0A1A7R4V3_9FLAO|nr:hypothetical protein [Gelidibacter algens]OBX26886.1 hypothetical protein A9996_02115 [Gelidibacter algens]RAJ26427.1 hypothetical protein LX77_00675 [Gelidibacter algens]
METKRRYTTMVFPQGLDGTKMKLNIVLIPRNQDPFNSNTGLPAPDHVATSFADLIPEFELKIIKGLDEWPLSNSTNAGSVPETIPINVPTAVNKKAVLDAIAAEFGAKINLDNTTDKAETQEITLNKYLPETYRDAFNFTTPRHKNAKTDDSYHCAIREPANKKPDWKTNDDMSWGQVFAHILRQPLLARSCGMIYSAEISIADHPDWYDKGSYVYVDLVNADYSAIQDRLYEDADGPFVKRYAARLPKLLKDKSRPVFAPLLFPVLYRKALSLVDPEPPNAPWDQIFAELNEYNDGFAKIVHAAQPVSSNLLREQPDGVHPVNDLGFRLAWDDEQILIWYIRQLTHNPEDPGKRIDAPLGVYGYKIDVKMEGATEWNSLNLVKSKQVYTIGGVSLGNSADDQWELPYQVFPTQPDNDTNGAYWLPMYFTSWIGKSVVLKDEDAILIYRNDEALDPVGNPKNVNATNAFAEVPVAAKLLYGNTYEFRVRLMDISGGGPEMEEELYNNAASPTAKRLFKRYIAPGLCQINKPEAIRNVTATYFNETLVDDNSVFDANPVLEIGRPLLTYPAVIFTNKYQEKGLDPVALLIQSSSGVTSTDAIPKKIITPAIEDPDVDRVEITVEVETLRMDNLLSESGMENYITLYKTHRNFPTEFDGQLDVPIIFRDVNSLNLGNDADPFNDLEMNTITIDAMNELPLPTARKIRITLRGVCKDQANYYGFENAADRNLDSRYGKTMQFLFYKESAVEDDMLLLKPNIAPIKAIYLQPDPPHIIEQLNTKIYYNLQNQNTVPDIVERLAQQLGVVSKGMTLVGEKGERVVFGCSNKIQHHLAPDHSSITLGSKGDLCNHWIGCLVYRINRDWSWDALKNVSFSISRTKKFKNDGDEDLETLKVGDIQFKHYASFESLIADDFGIVNRGHTTLIFIDAIEPKSRLLRPNGQLRFPDELEVEYTITPHFKADHGSAQEYKPDMLRLPTTIIPAQVPKIVSVGMAFSPYLKNEKYSATEPRQRYLWVELEEPVKDPHDTLFCRLLRYAPDQLLSHNREFMDETLPDPILPIDPEYVRSITPNQTDDMAGLRAMQAMEKASGNDDIHYLLPLPPGLHPESPEMFGFFTYEFRVGHGHWSNLEVGKSNLWSTAKGRFGRPLRVTGMQHPAPTLLCNVNRDDIGVKVNAPFAKTVLNGKDVTADPPRTQLHSVLYTQVNQADGAEFRNILLDEKLMTLVDPVKVKTDFNRASVLVKTMEQTGKYRVTEQNEQEKARHLLTQFQLFNQVDDLDLDIETRSKVSKLIQSRSKGKIFTPDVATSRTLLKAYEKYKKRPDFVTPVPANASFTNASLIEGAKIAIYKDKVKTGSCSWTNQEISDLINRYGLPEDAPLSVLVVEVFGNITNIFDYLSYPKEIREELFSDYSANIEKQKIRSEKALSDHLGHYRILRTSPLTEVPFICCVDC